MIKTTYLFLFIVLCSIVGASAQIDSTIGIKAPKSVSRSTQKLTHYLCDTLQGDMIKVNAIYNWVTHNIKYDVKAMQRGDLKRLSIKQVLKKKKALCDGYSDLFAEMCNNAGIKALSISGYARDWTFDDSDKFYMPRHAWNVVSIGDRWYPVDATWGAGVIGQYPNWWQLFIKKITRNPALSVGKLQFRYRYNPEWLMTSPAEFRLKHLPYDPIWQMTDSLMPLQVFEAGEASIMAFNSTYGRPMLQTNELNRFSSLPEHLRTIEETERAYMYNPRFYVSKALQHQANAIDSIATLDKNAPPAIRDRVVAQVQEEIRQALEFVALQKKSIATEYTELKRKNKTKNVEGKSYINSIAANNKQAITRCKSKINSSDKRYKSLQHKAGSAVAANKKVKPQEFDKIKTATPEDKPTTERLLKLADSVQARTTNFTTLQSNINAEEQILSRLRADNEHRLDTLAAFLRIADSALIKETIARINLEDNYDASVKKWSSIYKKARMQQADTLQRHYFGTYDSLLVHYELLRKAHTSYLQQYQKNFKDLAQYKRRNRSNSTLLAQYQQQLSTYSSSYNAQWAMINEYGSYLKANKSLLKQLVKHYEQQGKLVSYMKKAEGSRQKLEQKTLTKKETFDNKENKLQKKILESATAKSERFINKKK